MAFNIFYSPPLDSATLTPASASRWAAAYPLANIQDPRLAVKAQTDSGVVVTADSFVIDLGSAQGIDGVAVLYHNFIDGDGLTLQANSSDSWTSPAYSTLLNAISPVTQPDSPVFFGLFASRKTYRYWKLRWDCDADSRYIGRMILGPVISISSPSHGYEITHQDSSRSGRTRGGVVYSDLGTQAKIMKLSFPYLTTAEYQTFLTLWGTVGMAIPFTSIWTIDGVENEEFIFYGNISKPPQVKQIGPGIAYSLELELEEWK